MQTTFSEARRTLMRKKKQTINGAVWPTFYRRNILVSSYLSFERNFIRLCSPVHGIVTKTVHKTLLGVEGV